jgi:hypothetical protein
LYQRPGAITTSDHLIAGSTALSCQVDAERQKRGENERVGLCAGCHHARRIQSDRGSIFFLCELSFVDPDFPKYPRLPVGACASYERMGALVE